MMPEMRYFVLYSTSVFIFAAAVLVRGDGSGEEEVQFYLSTRSNTDEGIAEYQRIVSYAKMPQYETCWTGALKSLHASCKELTEDLHARLALKFANCFLEKSGLHTRPCANGEMVHDCVKASQADPTFFMSYLNFFTHTQNFCFYITAEMWQKMAENKVNRLLDASHSVAEQLDEATDQLHMASALQADILDSQKNALTNSKELAEQNQRLNETIVNSQIALMNSFGELQRSTKETHLWISGVADRLTHLQSVFIEQFNGFYSMTFYFASATGCFVLTATYRTAGARLWLFVLLFAVFFVERFLFQTRLAILEAEIGEMPDSSTITRILNEEAWVIRKFFWATASVMLFYYAFTFKDLNKENHFLIQDIFRQLANFQMLADHRQPSVEPAGFVSPDVRSYSRASLASVAVEAVQLIVSAPGTRVGSVGRSTPSREAFKKREDLSRLSAVPEEHVDLVDSSCHQDTPIRNEAVSRETTPVHVDSPGTIWYDLRSGSVHRESPLNGGSYRRTREKTPQHS